MTPTSEPYAATVSRLGLQRRDGDTFFGAYEGFPIAISPLGETVESGLLIQIRHPTSQTSLPDEDAYDWDEELRSLLAEGKVSLSVEDKIAWLSIYDAELVRRARVVDLLDSFLDGLSHAGIPPLRDQCLFCSLNRAGSLKFENGRVGQICNTCLADRVGMRQREAQVSATSLFTVALLGSAGSLGGAALWAGTWIASDWLVDFVSRDKDGIAVPWVLLIVKVGLIGMVTGGPTGYLICRIPERGDRSAGAVGALFGLSAVALGEIGFGTWLAYRFVGVASVPVGARIALEYWKTLDMQLLLRACAAVVAICFAYALARPKLTPVIT